MIMRTNTIIPSRLATAGLNHGSETACNIHVSSLNNKRSLMHKPLDTRIINS